MNGELINPNDELHLGIRGAGVTLILLLLSLVASNYVLGEALKQWHEVGGIISLQSLSDGEVGAIRLAMFGVTTPGLMFVIPWVVLKSYYPKNSSAQIFIHFGFDNFPSKMALLFSFVGGMAFLLLFSIVLLPLFPPDETVTAHPANAINQGSMWVVLLFAFSAIVFAPIAEEFLFRGVLYKGVSQSTNKIISALVISGLFILAHPDALRSGYWLTQVSLYMFPFLLVLLREKTGALYCPVMLHSGSNFAEIIF
jgi:membrane protease YdiL (CAAX protease family)